MNFLIRLIITSVAMCSLAAQAQSPDQTQAQGLTLKEVIRESEQDSLLIQKAQAGLEEAKWKKDGAYAGFLPSINGNLSYITDKKYMYLDMVFGGSPTSIPQIMPTTLYTLNVNFPVFDGFASTNRYRASSALADSAQSEYEWTHFTVTRQAILQFYKSLATKVLNEVAEQNLKTLQDHLKDIQAFKRAGVSTNYDVLRVEVQVSEAQSELLNTQDNVELAKYKLGEILGKEIETRNLSGVLPILTENIIDKLSGNILEQRKDIQALQKKNDASHYMHESLNRYWLPKISIFGSSYYYNNRNDNFQDSDNFRDAYTVGVNLTWNIFDGMASISQSGESAAQALQIEKSLQMSEIKAKQDFELWKRKYKYFSAIYQSRVGDVARSEEAVRLAKEGRKAGVRTSTELLDAESDLFRSKAGQVNAQIGAIEALINLELVSGQKLYDFN